MAAVGIDFGNLYSTVCVAQNRGIDTLLNEVNSRGTPSMVSFSEKRDIGEAALSQYNRNVKNTVSNLKRLIGRKFADPVVQEESRWLPFKMKELENGDIGIPVQYHGEEIVFRPEIIAGMLFHNLHKLVQKNTKTKIAYSVVSCPSYYSDYQRRALLAAYQIADIRPLCLVNEVTAAAYGFGIYQKDLPESGDMHIAFVDIGHSALQCSIVALNKNSMKVLATTFDESLGGRDLDRILTDHFAKEIKEKYKIDVFTNPKALVRLVEACEKVKKVLSANPQAPLSVSCLMNDIDVSLMIKREDFEQFAKGVFDRVEAPLRRAIERSGISVAEIAAVEALGGSVRIPKIQEIIKNVFEREPGRRLSSEETVAKGCAMQCAVLCPKFQVKRDFKVKEHVLYPITITYSQKSDNASEETSEIFNVKDIIPKSKRMIFKTAEEVNITARYSDGVSIQTPHIGKFVIQKGNPGADAQKAIMKVKLRLDDNMLFSIENAVMEEEYFHKEPKKEEPKKDEGKKEDEKKDGDVEMKDANADAEMKAAEDSAAGEEGEAKLKVRSTLLNIVPTYNQPLNSVEVQEAIEKELNMSAADQLVFDTADARNNLESYVYETRSKVSEGGALRPYLRPEVADEFVAKLTAMEDWLYEEEGENASKSEYNSKLNDLRVSGDRAERLSFENSKRSDCIKSVQANISHFEGWANSTDEKYAHISAEDREKVKAKCSEVQNWLNTKKEEQEKKQLFEDPAMTIEDLRVRQDTLYKFCNPIMSKAKPAPPKEEKKEEPKKEEEQQQPKEEEKKEDKKPKEEEKAGDAVPEPMDVDLD